MNLPVEKYINSAVAPNDAGIVFKIERARSGNGTCKGASGKCKESIEKDSLKIEFWSTASGHFHLNCDLKCKKVYFPTILTKQLETCSNNEEAVSVLLDDNRILMFSKLSQEDRLIAATILMDRQRWTVVPLGSAPPPASPSSSSSSSSASSASSSSSSSSSLCNSGSHGTVPASTSSSSAGKRQFAAVAATEELENPFAKIPKVVSEDPEDTAGEVIMSKEEALRHTVASLAVSVLRQKIVVAGHGNKIFYGMGKNDLVDLVIKYRLM